MSAPNRIHPERRWPQAMDAADRGSEKKQRLHVEKQRYLGMDGFFERESVFCGDEKRRAPAGTRLFIA